GGPADRDFEMMPSGHLTVRLVDSDSGRPIAGYMVQATGILPARGVFTASRAGDDGSFRFNGEMPPGNYTVRAFLPEPYRFSAGPQQETASPERGYGTTFFPGTDSADAATPLGIAPGEDRRVEIRVRAQDRFSIAGTIEVPKDKETDSLRVWLSRNG